LLDQPHEALSPEVCDFAETDTLLNGARSQPPVCLATTAEGEQGRSNTDDAHEGGSGGGGGGGGGGGSSGDSRSSVGGPLGVQASPARFELQGATTADSPSPLSTSSHQGWDALNKINAVAQKLLVHQNESSSIVMDQASN
jgi:hypothetical protein